MIDYLSAVQSCGEHRKVLIALIIPPEPHRHAGRNNVADRED
jgi:hypothetical protein